MFFMPFWNLSYNQSIKYLYMYTYSKPAYHHKITSCINHNTLISKTPNYLSNKVYNNCSPPQSPKLQKKQKQNNLLGTELNKQKSPTKNLGKQPISPTLHFRSSHEQKNRNPPKFLNMKAKDAKNGEPKKYTAYKELRYIKNIEELQNSQFTYKSKDKTSPQITYQHKIQRKDSDPNMNHQQLLKNVSTLSCKIQNRNFNPQQLHSQKQKLMQIIQHQKSVIKQKNQLVIKLQKEIAKVKEQFSKRQLQIVTQLEKKYKKQVEEKVEQLQFVNQKLTMQSQVFENIEKQLMKKQSQLNSLVHDYSALLINKSQLKSQVASLTTEITQLKKMNNLPGIDTQQGKLQLFNLQKQLQQLTQKNKNQHEQLTHSKKQLENLRQTCDKLHKFIETLNDDSIRKQLLYLNEKYIETTY